ncbi:GNAT family N-acetyltransferase [Georgenia ruanii]|uniref:GNAT family N-acetyltransferase n=1 Tax=Georgenia ruanii TaxID=348442 RepID=A0A7J9UUU0_9MICO|nr:GNAT family N-acetyltransferase [Georgenia ruanii]MPV88376.1 GNAT family N-acetyltransferase [Georgenia ruanii]
MSGTFAIREPSVDDADGVAEVHNRGWREAYGQLLPEEFYDDAALQRRKKSWRSLLGQGEPSLRLFVGEAEGRIVGVGLAGKSREQNPARDLELRTLYVISPYYGSGVAQALLDAAIGQERAQLWVARDNPRAQAFYRRNGFTMDGAEKVDKDIDNLVEVRFVR